MYSPETIYENSINNLGRNFLNQICKWMRTKFQMQGSYKRIRTPPSAARRVSYCPCGCDPKVWRSKQATPAPGTSSPNTTKNSSFGWDLRPLRVIHGCQVRLYLRSNIVESKNPTNKNKWKKKKRVNPKKKKKECLRSQHHGSQLD